MSARCRLGVLIACAAAVLAGCNTAVWRGASSPPLAVSITTHLGDAQEFRDGDPLSFFVSLGSDAHVLLLYEDARGAVSQIVPNARFDRTFLRAGDYISLPPTDAPFTLRVSAPFGVERVWLFASEIPFPGLSNRTAANGALHVEGSVAAVRDRLRAHASRNRARYGEASVSITTRPN